MDNEDELLFAEEAIVIEEVQEKETWKVMIVDDEQEVHNITRMVLSDFRFEGKELNFISAYNGKEAKELISKNKDTAVILLDVVMEEDNAGLEVAKYIRETEKNNLVRIILRTGQPGQAPEKSVIVDYDINDYKEKTELTSQKLFTTMVSALRAYRDLLIIDTNKKGLEKIIEASSTIFEMQSMRKFASGILTQLTAILKLNRNALYFQPSSFAATKNEEGFYILAATGDYYECIDKDVCQIVSGDIYKQLEKSYTEKNSLYYDDHFIIYFTSEYGSENMIYLEGVKKMNELDKDFIRIFCNNVSIAFDNIYLNKEVVNTQKEVIFTLGEIAEARSMETGHHVKRVAEYSKTLALKCGIDEDEAEVIRLASPMHDVGKLGIPDSILNKPGKLTAEEFEIVKTHSNIGYEMLKNSNKEIMKTAAVIALEHHEKYNGTGYPKGLKGEDIHIYGRITAIADVFDALGTSRVYKKAWELQDILSYFREQKGQHFDPKLMDIFLENIEEIIKIRDSFED